MSDQITQPMTPIIATPASKIAPLTIMNTFSAQYLGSFHHITIMANTTSVMMTVPTICPKTSILVSPVDGLEQAEKC